MNVGAAIRRLRLLNNMEQKDLAKLLNISNKTVSSWEHNRTEPKMEMIEKMCEIFHCKKSAFFEESHFLETDIDVIYNNEDLGQIVIEVPKEKEQLFTKINDRAMKLSDADLKKILGIINAFSESDPDQRGN